MESSKNTGFYTEFTYRPAIPYEHGVTRRDPSPVIKVGTRYYVWYSRSIVNNTGYYGTIWYATSLDRYKWTEQDEAIDKGATGEWDENGVYTPTILVTEGHYYLFYTGVPKPFNNDKGGTKGTPTAIGIAVADSPEGPWIKFSGNPILYPGQKGEFDSHRVDDSCMIIREGRYFMYYKGRQKGLSPGQTKMGLAIADHPTGPYVKSKFNPIISSGHEVCVWPHGKGIAAMIASCGPEANTIQYSPDGLHFRRRALVRPPSAPGLYREFVYMRGRPGIAWGLCQDVSSKDRPYLLRFDCDLRAEMFQNSY